MRKLVDSEKEREKRKVNSFKKAINDAILNLRATDYAISG